MKWDTVKDKYIVSGYRVPNSVHETGKLHKTCTFIPKFYNLNYLQEIEHHFCCILLCILTGHVCSKGIQGIMYHFWGYVPQCSCSEGDPQGTSTKDLDKNTYQHLSLTIVSPLLNILGPCYVIAVLWGKGHMFKLYEE